MRCKRTILFFLLAIIFFDEIGSQCPPPGPFKHSRSHVFRRGRKLVQFFCEVGYKVFGNPLRSCVNGKWVGSDAACILSGCPTHSRMENGARIVDMGGALLRHQCYQGYKLNGPSVTYCDGSNWNGTFPECIIDENYILPQVVELPPEQNFLQGIVEKATRVPPAETTPIKPRFVDSKDQNYAYFINGGQINQRLPQQMPLLLTREQQQQQTQQQPIYPRYPTQTQGNQFYRPQYPPNQRYPPQRFPLNPRFIPNFQDPRIYQRPAVFGYPLQRVNPYFQPNFHQNQTVFNNTFTQRFPNTQIVNQYFPPLRGVPPQQPYGPVGPQNPYNHPLAPPAFPFPQQPPHSNQMVSNETTKLMPNEPSVQTVDETETEFNNEQPTEQTTSPSGEKKVRMDCPPPPKIAHGYTVTKPLPRDFPDDDYLYFIEYRCLSGYELAGSEANSYCLISGKWSGDVPKCVIAQPKVKTWPTKATLPFLRPACPKGYERTQGICEDLDECDNDDKGGCEHKCINFAGGFYCQCDKGYKLGSDHFSCEDIDECEDEDKCYHTCENLPGSFQCGCREGYNLLPHDNRTCLDVNECLTTAVGACDQVCINLFGSFKCACREGFILADDGVTCDQTCENGFEIGDSGKCEDIDECATTTPCENICTNTEGSFVCSCHHGYELSDDQMHCQDINECETGDHDCLEACINMDGQYQCTCREYKILAEDGTCQVCPLRQFKSSASNECISCPSNSSLPDDPNPTYTIADCICYPGYRGNPEQNMPCIDIDECTDDNFGCSHICVNTLGSAFCKCPQGFELQEDGRVCEDRNECLTHNGGCMEKCHNLEGGYKCSCDNGGRLASDGKRCVSTFGHCEILEPLENGNIIPRHCTKTDVVSHGRVCIHMCNTGYQLVGSARRKCLTKGWSGEEAKCVEKTTCPRLQISEDMLVLPQGCATRDSNVNTVCSFQCSMSGFQINGSLRIHCTETGWSHDVPQCSNDAAKITPVIHCPDDISIDLPIGSSEADITIPQPSTNMFNVEKRILGQNSTSLFPSGITTIEFTAYSTDRSQRASCSMNVRVSDREGPMIQRCPGSFTHETNDEYPEVKWDLPIFRDNVGVVQVEWSRIPEGNITFGSYSVKYTARDAANNKAECAFTFEVTRKSGKINRKEACAIPGNPPNAKFTCNKWSRGLFCMLKCNPTFAFTSNPPSYVCDLGRWTWTPNRQAPTCVDTRSVIRNSVRQRPTISTTAGPVVSTEKTPTTTQISRLSRRRRPIFRLPPVSNVRSNISCPRGQVPQPGSGQDVICVDCPPGTYRPGNDAIRRCFPCPFGFFQEKGGMGLCNKCPQYTKNRHKYKQLQGAGRTRGFVSVEECDVDTNESVVKKSRHLSLINSLRSMRDN